MTRSQTCFLCPIDRYFDGKSWQHRDRVVSMARVGRCVSLQVAILKVLASYPDGSATVTAMNADLAILAGAGSAWTNRLKRLAAATPDLDIFGQGLVIRDAHGWHLTPSGRERLRVMEMPTPSYHVCRVE